MQSIFFHLDQRSMMKYLLLEIDKIHKVFSRRSSSELKLFVACETLCQTLFETTWLMRKKRSMDRKIWILFSFCEFVLVIWVEKATQN